LPLLRGGARASPEPRCAPRQLCRTPVAPDGPPALSATVSSVKFTARR